MNFRTIFPKGYVILPVIHVGSQQQDPCSSGELEPERVELLVRNIRGER